jgi:hypothetical protein
MSALLFHTAVLSEFVAFWEALYRREDFIL